MADNSYRKVKTTTSTRELNQHVRADEDDANMHYPKKFFGAFSNDTIAKDFRGQLEWRQHRILPNALAITSPTAIPTTQVDGDVYLLANSTVIFNVKDILFQTGSTVRYSFDGTPDLSGVIIGSYIRIKGAVKNLNNSTLKITAVDNTAKHVDLTNTLRINNVDDELLSPATATIAHTNWDENGEGDWVKYHAGDDFWYGTTPEIGTQCNIGDVIKRFTSKGWASSNVIISATYLIVSPDGDDATAQRGSAYYIFKTITAAKNAAVSGDIIIIQAGTYNEKNLLKNGVNYHFMPQAVVNYTGAEDGAIFDTSATGINTAVTCKITGHGEFIRLGSGNSASFKGIVYLNKNDNIYIEGQRMESNATTVWVGENLAVTTPIAIIRINADINSTTANATSVYAEQGGDLTVYADSILTDSASNFCNLCVWKGKLNVHAKLLKGSNIATSIKASEGGIIIGYIDKIEGKHSSIKLDGGKITLYNSDISSTLNFPNISTNIDSPVFGNGILILNNCAIGSAGTQEIISLRGTSNIFVFQNCYIKKSSATGAISVILIQDTSSLLELINTLVINRTNLDGANGILMNQQATLVLDSARIVTTFATSNSVKSVTAATPIKVLSCRANKAVDANTTQQVATILVDANVSSY